MKELKKESTNDKAMAWVKMIMPVLLLLLGTTGYNTYTSADSHDIEVETKENVDLLFTKKLKELNNRLDSMDKSRTMALSKGLSAITNMSLEESDNYVNTIIPWSLEKFKEDTVWQRLEKPMLYEVYAWYLLSKNDCDVIRVIENQMYYVDCDGKKTKRRLIFGKVGNWSKKAWYYRNELDEAIRISELSNMAYWANQNVN